MKNIYLLISSFLLLSGIFAQSDDIPSYSLLFADNIQPGQPIFDMSIGHQEISPGTINPLKEKKASNWKPIAITSGILIVSGFCDGTSEVLKIKYNSFERVFPNANDEFWDYKISWKNKYKDGIPPDPAFLGSKTSLVWTTDGYHMMRAIRNATMITALVIPLNNISHKNWKDYVKEGVINYFSYTVGFNLAYDVVFK